VLIMIVESGNDGWMDGLQRDILPLRANGRNPRAFAFPFFTLSRFLCFHFPQTCLLLTLTTMFRLLLLACCYRVVRGMEMMRRIVVE